MREIDGCGMDKFGTIIARKMIAILGHKWWPQTVREEGDFVGKKCIMSCVDGTYGVP